MKRKTRRRPPAEAVAVAAALVLVALVRPAPAGAADAAEAAGTSDVAGVVAGLPAVPGAPASAAGVAGDEDLEWETQSVRELLRRDIREALQSPVTRGGGAAARPAGAVPAGARPRLMAMYGVGRDLMAEVQVGSRAFLYVRGQALPVGHTGDAAVYRLRDMNGACIQLERGEDRHSLCLRAMLSEARP
ncbi:hypothetical protein [Castellaniella sp. GW247-6E4]|uniref:hypothetical protein n=1 Tax=Castellaniella sp. GW247-6E4 TaxID=3140380 RepID=UPI0033152DD9